VPACAHGVRLAALAALAAGVAGCGFGSGDASDGEATLTVTRDYGSQRLAEATQEDPSESETVIRFLDREAEITTRYGGGFVQSIEGFSGTIEDGRSFDWFFYVDGIESSVGSAEREVLGGHRIWWDYRDWTDAMRVPAVVGSWPEPLLQGSADDPLEVGVECEATASTCDEVDAQLAEADVEADVVEPGAADESAPRVLVGEWQTIRDDPAAAQLDDGPATSGVFARFERSGAAYRLVALDHRGAVARELDSQAGLVAAVRDGEAPPTWLVTGSSPEGVAAAAGLLESEALSDRYAVAVDGDGAEIALPVLREEG
jgi:Domain of unknown function (DUF4430)